MEVVELGEDNMKHRHIIRSVEDGSIAWELGVEPGDCLISINDKEIEKSGSWRLRRTMRKIWESSLSRG